MKTIILALSLVLPSLAFAQAPMQHLTFLKGELHAHVHWTQGPVYRTESIMNVEFVDKTHQPVELPAELKVTLWMPSMGHGSAPTTVEKVLDDQGVVKPGEYRISKVYFIMKGDWEVNLTLLFPDKTTETQTIKLKL